MSLADVIDDVHIALENKEKIDFNKISEGKAFITRLIMDSREYEELIKSCEVSLTNRKWLESNPFPLTVEILNRDEAPGEEVHVRKGYKNIIVVYYGLCPELENFVSVVLWPQTKNSTSNIAYKKIFEMVKEDKDKKRVIVFSKKYGLHMPNTIHPANDDEIDTIEKARHVYDWEYVPYLKDTGDTILSHNSPLNFRKVYVDELTRLKSYINLRVIVGRVQVVGKSDVQILVPSFYGRWLEYRAKIRSELSSKLSKDSLNYFMIMERLDGNVQDIVAFSSPANPIDIVGHLLSTALYAICVHQKRLRIGTFAEYEVLYQKCLSIVRNFCIRDALANPSVWTAENIFHAYLSPHFRIIGDSLFFVPNNQHSLSDQMLLLYDNRLSSNAASIAEGGGLQFDERGNRIDLRAHAKVYRFVRFATHLKHMMLSNPYRSGLCDKLISEIRRPSTHSNS